jgi:hypothetical protein
LAEKEGPPPATIPPRSITRSVSGTKKITADNQALYLFGKRRNLVPFRLLPVIYVESW